MTSALFYKFKRVTDVPLQHFQVFGERRTGTNYLDRLIKDNLSIEPTNRYGWKHGTISMPCIAAHGLIVVVVRDPLTWLSSLHNRPFTKANSGLPFSEFLRTEWYDEFIPKDFGHARWGYSGMVRASHVPNQVDRHPITGKRFKNPLELRVVKTAGFLGFLERECNVAVVDYRYINTDPAGFISRLSDDFSIAKTTDFERPDRVGALGTNQPRKAPTDISAEDMDFIRTALDQVQETFLGYADDLYR
ncbi:hypothetical protein [uncultured Aliiroseovarius sp.]|uniref:hypothetical protein n=1 Tax=uncultured Aliiroseovarius sp. TaxID=1658783 RepID=UPI00263821B1|nr:hypothetical protein [uncultured Aliiroseovarius sp.]